jgi:hypothetical protein
MKAAIFVGNELQDSSRIAVERAVALSKEQDSKWKDADTRPPERPEITPDRIAEEQHSGMCHKVRR